MPRSLELNVDSNTEFLRKDLGRMAGKIPEANDRQAQEIALTLAKEIRKSISSEFNNGDRIKEGIDVRQREAPNEDQSRYQFVIDAPIGHGRKGDIAAWNEFANNGHFVPITWENSPIYSWASQNNIELPDDIAATYTEDLGNYPGVHVEPNPFMSSPVKRATRKIRRFVANGGTIDDALKTFG